ncbi:TonB-dependent siderophore receptor [Nostoc sp. CCCryo 231-06]|nr:TonB-dependent siderophore receptor [Nostoc sp. CCCryo 231-06]
METKKLSKILLVTSSVWLWCTMNAAAQEIPKPEMQNKSMASVLRNSRSIREIRQLSEIEHPSTSAQMLVQSPASTNPPSPSQGDVIQVTGVQAKPTDKGVEVILQTTQGEKLQITNRSADNNFIADIPNAQLRSSSGEAFTFRSEKPLAGIIEITVTNVDASTVRVTVVGEKTLPTVELFDDDAGVVFGITSAAIATQPQETAPAQEKPAAETPQEESAAQPDEPIELVVTGEQDGYRVPNASTATRTDTPLRDIPASIQVVPRQVLEDRNVRTVTEALETVSGVALGSANYGNTPFARSSIVRGFEQGGASTVIFRNGFPDGDFNTLSSPIKTIERVEILKGPASVLFGSGEPGGIINTVTKKPLSEPYYNLAFEAGNYGLYQPSIDFSGSLNTNKTVLYRFIASYQGSSDFQGFSDNRLLGIAPSITLKLGDRTNLNLYYEYTNLFANPAAGFSNAVLLGNGSLTPRGFATYYPGLQSLDVNTHRIGYTLEHEFSDNWQIRNNVAVALTRVGENFATGFSLVDDRFLDSFAVYEGVFQRNTYFGQIDLLGKFKTGSISHQVLTGFDFNRFSNVGDRINADTSLPPLDIRNPNYDITRPTFSKNRSFSDFNIVRRSYGLYLQDQVAFGDNLKFLIGGRFDSVSSDFEGDINTLGEIVVFPTQNDTAFSPRIGLVYQPSRDVSLYASYTRSFAALAGLDSFDPDITFAPTKGTQYEIGVKSDFLDGRLSATLAAYQLTKTNALTGDPTDPLRSIQTGEQQSRGVELDLTGEILPGWNVIASYAYTNAELTKDNTFTVGNRLPNVPKNQASLWTTYTIQKAALSGLGFGLGLFYVGARQGDLNNSFELGDYFRTDAALYYRRDRFNVAINVRNLFDIDATAFAGSRTFIKRTEPFTITGSISWEF